MRSHGRQTHSTVRDRLTSLNVAGENEANLAGWVRRDGCEGVVHRRENLRTSVKDGANKWKMQPQTLALSGYHACWSQRLLHILIHQQGTTVYRREPMKNEVAPMAFIIFIETGTTSVRTGPTHGQATAACNTLGKFTLP